MLNHSERIREVNETVVIDDNMGKQLVTPPSPPVSGWLAPDVQSLLLAMLVSGLLAIVISLSSAWLVSAVDDVGTRKLRGFWGRRRRRRRRDGRKRKDDETSRSIPFVPCNSSEEDDRSSCNEDEDDSSASCDEGGVVARAANGHHSDGGGGSEDLLLDDETTGVSATEVAPAAEADGNLATSHGGRPRLVVRTGRGVTFRWDRERRRHYNRL